ncbi:hypothetical protein MP638_006668 [Amoeboaphelidium occidentale]|nr:hypothetical protein MP638_006668 [Amoeboaphelidium occidentale]
MSVQVLNDAENLSLSAEADKKIYCREVLIQFSHNVSIDQIFVESSSRFIEVFFCKTDSLDSEEYFETFQGYDDDELQEGDLWYSVFVEKRLQSVCFLRLKLRRESCLRNVIVIVDKPEIEYKVTFIKDDGTPLNANKNRKDSAIELEPSSADISMKVEGLEKRVEYLEQQVKTLLEIIKGGCK